MLIQYIIDHIFQQPMRARTMRVCTVCSERWDTVEDGGGDYRWVGGCKKKKSIHTEDTTSRGEKYIYIKKGKTRKGKKQRGAGFRTREL